MTNKEIEKELKKIYKEMGRWSKLNARLKGPVPKDEVRRRENILSLQLTLYRVQDAKKKKDKKEEYFNLAQYYLTKSLRNTTFS